MEIKPNKIKKFNKPIVGLGLGIAIPLVCFLLVFLYFNIKGGSLTFSEFIDTLKSSQAFIPVISICVVPNLILYFILKRKDYWYAIKGVVTSVLLYTVAAFILKFM